MLYYCLQHRNLDKKTMPEKINYAITRLDQRTEFHKLLYKLLFVAYEKGLRLIIENPAAGGNYLITGQNFPPPTIIDKDRQRRGDYFKKPTAYWFINCEPTAKESFQEPTERKTILGSKASPKAGLCSEDRSMMAPEYARNFICDYIIGREQPHTTPTLFDDETERIF